MRGALGGVTLEHRGLGNLGHLGDVPGVAPGQRLALASSALSGLHREGLGVGVRVLIVRPPAADIDVVLTRPVLGQVCLSSPGMISTSTPACAQVAWIACARSLVGELLRVSMVTLKPSGSPALASSSLALARSNR